MQSDSGREQDRPGRAFGRALRMPAGAVGKCGVWFADCGMGERTVARDWTPLRLRTGGQARAAGSGRITGGVG